MKIVSSILFSLIIGASLTSASDLPSAHKQELKESPQQAPVTQQAPANQQQARALSSAIKVITPQKDLETAIRTSELGDILLLGTDTWYRLDIKALKQGTKVFVLGNQNSMVSTFPKEAKTPSTR